MKKIIPTILIIIIGIYAGFAILKTEKATSNSEHGHHEDSHEDSHQEIPKGSHRGKLFSKNGFSVEVTLYETGISPEFRVYILDNNQPVSLDDVKLIFEIKRLEITEIINFKKFGDYLLGDQEIYEPHSFDVKITADYKGNKYIWEYESSEGRTELTEENINKSGIIIEKSKSVSIKNKLELPGEIVLNKDRISHVAAQLSGIVTYIGKNMGDNVKKGELIAVIKSRELAEAKSEYIEAIHHYELVNSIFNREKKLWEKKLTSEESYYKSSHSLEEASISVNITMQKLDALGLSKFEIDQIIKNPKQNLSRYEIHAPWSGVVIEKDISMGEFVKSNSDMFIIADMSTVWANITVYPKNLNSISKGQQVTIKSKSFNETSNGKVIFIGSLVGKDTRTANAYVLINNSAGVWKPGMFISSDIHQEDTSVPMAVRVGALQSFRNWDVVFINKGNVFQAQPVEIGKRDNEWVEIISGLPKGVNYVSKNSYLLKAEIEKSSAGHDH